MTADHAAWRAAAERLGGVFELDDDGTPGLRARFAGVAIGARETAATGSTIALITAGAPSADALVLTVRGHHPALGDVDGARPADLQLADLGRRFRIDTNDVGFARAWLGDAVRAHITATDPDDGYSFGLRDGLATAHREGHELDANRLVRATRAVAALAGQDRALFHRWRMLAADVGGRLVGTTGVWRPGASIAIETSRGGTSLTIDSVIAVIPPLGPPGRAGHGVAQLYTRVRCARDHARHVFRFVGAGCRDFEAIAAVCGRAIGPALELVVADAIDGTATEVTAYLAGLPTEPDRLRAALDIVEALAGDGGADRAGPYR